MGRQRSIRRDMARYEGVHPSSTDGMRITITETPKSKKHKSRSKTRAKRKKRGR